MRAYRKLVLASIFLLLVVGRGPLAVTAGVVFDNTADVTADVTASCGMGCELGEQVTLAGSERVVTRFLFGYRGFEALSGAELNEQTVRVRFYENAIYPYGDSGRTGLPGALLFDSGPLPIRPGNTGPRTLTLRGLSVPVDGAFTWTVEFSATPASAVSVQAGLRRVGSGPPDVGAVYQMWSRLAGESWLDRGAAYSPDFPDYYPFEARITAIAGDPGDLRYIPLDSAFGPDTIIRDKTRRVDYLSLKVSTNMGIYEVIDATAPGGIFEGFRVAASGEGPSRDRDLITFIELYGPTFVSRNGLPGLAAMWFFPNSRCESPGFSQIFRVTVSPTYIDTDNTECESGRGNPGRGTWLVRDVPTDLPVDIKPLQCPNTLNANGHGTLSVAILGTAALDVSQIDPSSVRLIGVAPTKWRIRDVATPAEPLVGKTEADCNTTGPDGHDDLRMTFDIEEVVAALGLVSDGEVRTLELTGTLKARFGDLAFRGEDVVVIRKTRR